MDIPAKRSRVGTSPHPSGKRAQDASFTNTKATVNREAFKVSAGAVKYTDKLAGFGLGTGMAWMMASGL